MRWWNGWILQAVHYHHLLVCIENEVHGSADVSVFRFLQELSQSAWFTSLSGCPTTPKQEILSSTRPALKPPLWGSTTSHFYTQSIINMNSLCMWKSFDMIFPANRLKKSNVQRVNRSTRLRSAKNLIQPDSKRRALEERMNWSVLVALHLKKSWNPRMPKIFAFVIDCDTQRKY